MGGQVRIPKSQIKVSARVLLYSTFSNEMTFDQNTLSIFTKKTPEVRARVHLYGTISSKLTLRNNIIIQHIISKDW